MIKLNWCAYNYRSFDGYGRYSSYLVKALQTLGVDVNPFLSNPEWTLVPHQLKRQMGIQENSFTISCMPPFFLHDNPSGGRHWLITMTEGSELPGESEKYPAWADIINASDVERVIVPCEHNAKAFRDGGVKVPVHVVHGGTDPDEFAVITEPRPLYRPYTFLALGDRGSRKGWCEVYAAFYKAFGKPQDTSDVRLIIKCRPDSNEMLDVVKQYNTDPRICVQIDDAADMREVYKQADCFAIPSRSEGWGMPHREAAMMGIPVITQAYSGMDDGHTGEWALVVKNGTLERISTDHEHIKGEWMKADIGDLANVMRLCYENPRAAAHGAKSAAQWLRDHQTWWHSAKALLNLIQEYS